MVKLKDRVRFVETDMMGVVHHANYFRWFEMGRVEYLRQAGVDLLELMEADYIFPITDARCSYKKPARFADEIIICADMIELYRVKMVFSYKIKNDVLIEVSIFIIFSQISIFDSRFGHFITYIFVWELVNTSDG